MVPSRERKLLWWWLLLLFLSSSEVFHFIVFRRHPSPFRELSPGLHPFYTFSPAHRRVICDTFILAFLGFSFYRELYGFEQAFFYPQAFFTLHFFPTFWHVFWFRFEQEHPIQDLPLYACSRWVVPSGLRVISNYWCLNYKTIGLLIALVIHEIKKKQIYWICFRQPILVQSDM